MLTDWPAWLPGVIQIPDDQYLAGELPLLKTVPDGVVIHSGDEAPNVAEYITTHRYSYHFAKSEEHGQIVQTVPLTHRAQHAGRAGNDWWGLALSGPDEQDPRSELERMEFQRVLALWLIAAPGLTWWCRHSDIKATKRDPGPGFLPRWAEDFGLRWKRGPNG